MKPFDRPHPVRAYLDDPRVYGRLHVAHVPLRHRHLGPSGTPVFAIERGTAAVSALDGEVSGPAPARSSTGTSFRPSGRASRSGGTLCSAEPVRSSTIVHLSEQCRLLRQPAPRGRAWTVRRLDRPTATQRLVRHAGHRTDPRAVRGSVDLVADARTSPGRHAHALAGHAGASALAVLKGGAVGRIGWHAAHDFQRAVLRAGRSRASTPTGRG